MATVWFNRARFIAGQAWSRLNAHHNSVTGSPVPDPVLVSFPKSGRTWLRLMLDRLQVSLLYSHDESDHKKGVHLADLSREKTEYQKKKVIFLTRDVRDTVVSGYFQTSRRLGIQAGTMAEFIRDPRHGIEKVITFNKNWLDAAPSLPNFLLVRYEDLHEDAAFQLRRIFDFLELDVATAEIDETVRYARFENLQAIEKAAGFDKRYGKMASQIFSPAGRSDPEALKMRKGRIGGYKDYLSADDIAFCNVAMERSDWPRYCEVAAEYARIGRHKAEIAR